MSTRRKQVLSIKEKQIIISHWDKKEKGTNLAQEYATEDRPAYQITTEDGSHSNTDVFEKIENASTLWRKEKDW